LRSICFSLAASSATRDQFPASDAVRSSRSNRVRSSST
jgi:hypothetical protein